MPAQASHNSQSWGSAFQAPGHQSPFSTAAPPDDGSSRNYYAPYDPEDAAIYSNLVRRSRSLTNADTASIDADLQPTGRRRSFFSPKKPKAAPDQSQPSSSVRATSRSFSGLLPNQLGREDSKALLDSDKEGAKSFVVRGSKADDVDSSTGKGRSAKWWSWGSSKAPPKPDGKLATAVQQNSVPVWSSDSLPQSAFADGSAFTNRQQPAAPSTAQDGYADLLTGLGSHGSPAAANAAAPPSGNASGHASVASKQNVSHSRQVSWDDSIFDASNAAAAVQHADGLPFQGQTAQLDSSSAQSLSPRGNSLDIPEGSDAVPIPAAALPSVATNAASNANSAATASLGEADSPNALPAVDGEKKKGHRRGRSLTGFIPTLKTKPKRSVSELLPAEPTIPAAGSSQVRPKTPDAKAASSNSSLVQCFGMGKTLDDAAEKEEAPPGVVGLRNLGNTCFVNVALQCLRYTPQLATAIIPDLMTLSPLPEEGSFSNSSLALPRISLQQSPVKHSSHEGPHDLLQPSSPQQTPAQTLDSQAAAPQQQASSLQPEGNVGHQQQAVGHDAQSQSGASAAAQLPEVSSVAAPSQQYDEGKQHPSNALESNPQALHSVGDKSAQQGDSNLLQSHAPQQQSADVPAAGDDSAAAPPNEPTAEKQPPPVASVRVPLKKGEIADAFRALVREVYSIGGHNSQKEAVDPAQFLRRISQLSAGVEFCDGGQHDGHELLRLLLHSLHDDLNRITNKPAYEEDKDIPGEAENDKADRFWRKYLERDNSPITDLFGGQLQSTVHCHKCKGNFTTYEPFWDLSVPIAKEGKIGISAWLSGKTVPTTIQDCLQAFTGDELLQGDESFKCELCGEKTQATKRMRLHRLPKVLLLHIKRFKYSGSSREKLTANVSFPTKALKLNQFVSADSSPADSNASYDLYAVSNHFGSMAGGHYTAACRVGLPDGREQWYNFNDTAVAKLSPAGVVSACAYILFYVRVD